MTSYPGGGLSEVVTTTLRNRSGELKDNVSRNNALLARLEKNGNIEEFSGGRTILEELDFQNNQTFQWYSGYQVLNIAPSTVMTSAEYPIRQAALTISISGLEEIQNSGGEQIIDLLAGRIKNGHRTFRNGLSQGIYGDGTVTGSINGLQLLISTSPTTGTVGGISRSSQTYWQNIKWSALSNGGVPLSAASIQSQMNQLYMKLVRGDDHPDLIVCDNTTYNYYLESLQALQRWTNKSDEFNLGAPELQYMKATVILDGGFQGFSTDPLPPQLSSSTSAVGGVPATTMYFVNTTYLKWRPYRGRDMVVLDNDRFSVNQDAMVRILGWAGNMTLSNAFLQGVLVA